MKNNIAQLSWICIITILKLVVYDVVIQFLRTNLLEHEAVLLYCYSYLMKVTNLKKNNILTYLNKDKLR